MFRWAILIIIGVVISDLLSNYISAKTWLGITAICVAIAGVYNKKHPIASSIMLLIAVTCIGGFRLSISEMDNVSVDKEQGSRCRIAVITEPIVRGKVLQFDGLICKNNATPSTANTIKEYEGRRIRVSLLRDTITKKYENIHIGDGIECQADISPLIDWHRQNSHFDYIRWLHARGFIGRAFIGINKWQETGISWKDISITEMVKLKALTFREEILKRMASNGMDKESFAVATAMSLGNKSALNPKIREEYNIAGASHILALSGVHLSVIYAIFIILIGRRKRWCGWLVITMIWAYVIFTGMSISVMRAAYMLTIWEVMRHTFQEQKVLNVLGCTACIMVLTTPQCIWDIGFQMSFAAVLSIIALMDPLRELMPVRWRPRNKKEQRKQTKWEIRKYKALRNLWYIISVSISAQLGTLPLTMYYFGRISCAFLLTNFIVIVSVTTIIWLTLLLAAIMTFDMLAGIQAGVVGIILSKVLSHVTGFINYAISWIASLPGSSIEGIEINTIQVIAMYVIIIAIVLYANKKKIKEWT